MEETYLSKQESKEYSHLSESTLKRGLRRALAEVGLNWRTPSEVVQTHSNKVRKKGVSIDRRGSEIFEWFYSKNFLDEIIEYTKERVKKGVKPPSRSRSEVVQEEKQRSSSEEGQVDKVLIDKDLLLILKEDREGKKEIEKDYRELNKSYQMKDEGYQRTIQSIIESAKDTVKGYKKQIAHLQKRLLQAGSQPEEAPIEEVKEPTEEVGEQ